MRHRLLLLALLAAASAQAQIVLTTGDLQNAYFPGNMFETRTAYGLGGVAIGPPKNTYQAFNFWNVTWTTPGNVTVVDEARHSTYADSFPGAQIVQGGVLNNQTGKFYYTISDSGLLLYGFASDNGVLLMRLTPPELVLKVPAGIDSAWETHSDSSMIAVGGFPLKLRVHATHRIDAWGSLNVDERMLSTLRLRTVREQTIIGRGSDGRDSVISSTANVVFVYATTGGMRTVSVTTDTTEQDSSTVYASDFSYTQPYTGSGVKDEAPAVFSMHPYPTPSNERVQMSYLLLNPANVFITVVDEAGKDVQTIDAGEVVAGSHPLNLDVAQLPAGRYVCRVAANGHATSVPIVVAR